MIQMERGGDMRVALSLEDVERLNSSGNCFGEAIADGAALATVVECDEFTPSPIARTDGHSLHVYLPAGEVVLPLDVQVERPSHAADYYFGQTGKVCLLRQVELSHS